MASPQHSTLREARAQYFQENGIEEDGGYGRKWVRIKLGPVPVVFPNTSGRRAVLLQHDLHHVATGYDTTLVGEAEIGAWELASGCRHYYAAWILNLGAVVTGLFLAPGRVVRAFQRGRRCTNLYHLGVDASWPEETVSRLRQDHRATGLFPVLYPIPKSLQPELDGRRVAIVNDVINAGSAVRGTLAALKECGAQPVAIATLAVYGDAASELAARHAVALETLATFPNRIWEPSACPLCAKSIPVDA